MKKFLPGNRKKERKPSDDEIQTRKSRTFILLEYKMNGILYVLLLVLLAACLILISFVVKMIMIWVINGNNFHYYLCEIRNMT